MSNNPQKGLRIGKYLITPLGIATAAALLVLIIGGGVLAIANPFGGKDVAAQKPVATEAPEAEGDELEPVATVVPTPTPEPEPRSATIRTIGEIYMQQNLLRAAVNGNTFDFSEMFSLISNVMGDADYTVADVEGTLGGTTEYSGSTRMITPPALIQTLQDCGVDMLTLANHHALDGGFNELLATIQQCNEAGMDYCGAAASAEERATPVIKEIGGINVAFIGYTESLNGNEKNADPAATEYGVALITNKVNAKQEIADARAAGADVVVCYVSWGETLKSTPTDTEKLIAQKLTDWGADVIIGSNPHVVQPAAWLESKDSAGNVHRALCLGATGNFLSDLPEAGGQYDSGIIFQFTITETEYGHFAITSPTYIPTYVWRSTDADGKYAFHTLAVGQWLESEPEGMAYADAARMRQVWADTQSIMGSEVATVAAE